MRRDFIVAANRQMATAFASDMGWIRSGTHWTNAFGEQISFVDNPQILRGLSNRRIYLGPEWRKTPCFREMQIMRRKQDITFVRIVTLESNDE